jgi:pyruvate/2-oxoglutarate dehydrogenase complex dihydrolipoamide dehydrogenase (E3) component
MLTEPLDAADRELLQAVHPPEWQNPAPRNPYDLVVIGGGTAGLVSAVGAAGLGARVALIERDLLGGDCLNTGCVPSKAIIRSARAADSARRAGAFGVTAGRVETDFGVVMKRMRERRAGLAAHDSARRLQQLGVDVFLGAGGFTSRESINVSGSTLMFSRAIIATGGRPAVPPIPGLHDGPFLTSETVFSLTALPRRLLVIGGGPIGCELAQAFAAFGSAVTVLDQAARVLGNDDPDAAAIVQQRLAGDGVSLLLGSRLLRASYAQSEWQLTYVSRNGDGESEARGDALLVAAGRIPNLEPLELPRADVEYSKAGVTVDDHLRTSNRRIFAAGDVCSAYKFTHAADALARIALTNALFFGRRRASALVVPWCTYTTPELAHVGLSEHEARDRGDQVTTLTVPFAEIDRAVLDDETDGFVRLHHQRGRILGCTIVGPNAGELISHAALAINRRGTLGELSATIYPYPTLSDAFKKAGDAHRRSSLTPRLRRWLTRYFDWTR